MHKLKSFIISVKGKIILGVFVSATSVFFTSAISNSNLFEISKNIDIFTSVYKELNTYYVDDVDPNKLMRTGIDAMLASLDPYTNYYSEADMEGFEFQITGNYGGIGATIRPINGKVTVADIYKGFAADKAGLQTGDILLEIDGRSTEGKNNEQVSEFLRGSPGTTVNVKFKHPFNETINEVTITREEIKIENVPYYGMIDNETGYIQLTQFTEDAGKNVENALRNLESKNPQMTSVILDLRGNPGGLLREAVNVSNVFIDKGNEVCSTKGRVEEWNKTFEALNAAVDTKIPLVILANRMSASASEIVAGAIQDYDRGVIVGEKTYGKGLVQTTRDLAYKTRIKLTTAKYYIPSGRCIQALDYSRRNDDGSVGKIPDSLKTAFQTSTGRIVYDGGGIDPDVSVEPEKYKEITISLLTKNLIFEYATKYKYEHPAIAEAKSFTLTAVEYDDFVKFLSDKEYDYTTGTEKLLSDFEASAKQDEYYDALKADLADLKTRIGHDKQKDLYKFKDEILFELNKEIVSRYYGDAGITEVGFKYDPDIRTAKEVLKDKNKYATLLTPAK